MEKSTVNQNVLKNCYKNAKMAILSIEDILPKCDGALKEELISQHEGYNNHLTEIALTAVNVGIDLPDVSGISKGMLNASINMKTLIDDSHSHLAEMLIKGSVMGYTTQGKQYVPFGDCSYLCLDYLGLFGRYSNLFGCGRRLPFYLDCIASSGI